MARFSFLALVLFFVAGAQAFTVSPMSFPKVGTVTTSSLSMATDVEQPPTKRSVERGVSVDQDGKSNVWAIEPKMEVSSKSSEEKTQSALFAVGGLVGAAALAAVILTNFPDPNQF
ncbi:hypothetical protein ACA910_018929 [Epithemia clementina (nom. ined.)]